MGPRRAIILLSFLTVVVTTWWFFQWSLTSSNQKIIEQAMEVMTTQPRLAEEMLNLVDGKDSNPQVLAGLVEAQRLQGRLDVAEELAGKWVALSSADILAWEKLADLQRTQNLFVRAQATLQAGIASLPLPQQRDSLRVQLIEYLLLADNNAEATQLYERLETDGLREKFRETLNFAQLLRLNGNLKEAREATEAYLFRNSGSTAALMLRGVILLDQKEYQRAADDLAAVVADSPRNKEAHYKLAMALRGLSRYDEATEHLKISMELTDEATRHVERP